MQTPYLSWRSSSEVCLTIFDKCRQYLSANTLYSSRRIEKNAAQLTKHTVYQHPSSGYPCAQPEAHPARQGGETLVSLSALPEDPGSAALSLKRSGAPRGLPARKPQSRPNPVRDRRATAKTSARHPARKWDRLTGTTNPRDPAASPTMTGSLRHLLVNQLGSQPIARTRRQAPLHPPPPADPRSATEAWRDT